MRINVKPEYFATIHYYFFFLGAFSVTSAFLYSSYPSSSAIFIIFYLIHAAISCYLSLFLHFKIKEFFVTDIVSYMVSHAVFSTLSAGLAIFMWFLFRGFYEAFIQSSVIVNFLAVFVGLFLYFTSMFEISGSIFDWKRRKEIEKCKNIVIEYRRIEGLRLVDDDEIINYKPGSDNMVDEIFIVAKKASDRRDIEELASVVRSMETIIFNSRIKDLENTIEKMKGSMSESD